VAEAVFGAFYAENWRIDCMNYENVTQRMRNYYNFT
jgi:hypothetical protein